MNRMQEILIGRIDELCKEKDLTYYTLAYKAAVPLSTLIHIIDGTTKNPGIFTIARLCVGLEVTLPEFFSTLEFSFIEDVDA